MRYFLLLVNLFVNQPISYQYYQPIPNQYVEDFPTMKYKTKFFHEQEKMENKNHLDSKYRVVFNFDNKDFEKYSLDFYSYNFGFKLTEQITLLDNSFKTYVDEIKFGWSNKTNLSKKLENRFFIDDKKNEVKITPLVNLMHFTKGYSTIEITHENMFSPKLQNKNVFKKRTIEINEIFFSIKPKEDLDFLVKETIHLSCNPKVIWNEIDSINSQINIQLNILLDKNKVDRRVYNHFYESSKLSSQQIVELSNIDVNLKKTIIATFVFTKEILADSFLKNLKPASFFVETTQHFDISQVGINQKIFTSISSEKFDESQLFNILFSNDILFKNFFSIEKVNSNLYKVYSTNPLIANSIEVEIIFTSKTKREEVAKPEERPEKIPNDLIDEIGESTVSSKNSKNKSFITIIMFSISIIFLLLINIKFIIKKILFSFKKN